MSPVAVLLGVLGRTSVVSQLVWLGEAKPRKPWDGRLACVNTIFKAWGWGSSSDIPFVVRAVVRLTVNLLARPGVHKVFGSGAPPSCSQTRSLWLESLWNSKQHCSVHFTVTVKKVICPSGPLGASNMRMAERLPSCWWTRKARWAMAHEIQELTDR